jgi:threonine dehydrogenase-like Zn-dependent dehydrogenase
MIPSDMKAAVYRGKGKVVVERVPVPAAGAGEVLVRIAACGVCHTDLKKVEYGLQVPPRIYGHEMAGTIVAMGRGVKGWKIGDRVAVFHHIPCGKCFYCDRADYAQCPVYKKTGSTAGFEAAVRPGRMPLRHVWPESVEVDQPMPAAPPSPKRPTWNVATAVVPAPATLGSTCVWCCAPALVSESDEIRRDTSSQSLETVSARSAVTASRPLPHVTRSLPP